MISWARAVLGQTQEPPETVVRVEDVVGSPQDGVRVYTAFEAPRGASSASSWASPVPIILCLALAAGTAMLFVAQLRRIRDVERQLQAARQQADQLLAQNQGLTEQLSTVQAERNALDERLFSVGVQLSTASSELERAHERLAASERIADQLAQVEAKLQWQVEATGKARRRQHDAQQEVELLRQERAELSRSVGRLRHQLAIVERDHRELAAQLTVFQAIPHPGVQMVSTSGSAAAASPGGSTASAPVSADRSVELLPVIVRKAGTAAMEPIRGHLIDVNAPHQFVILDKGTMDGVHEGMMFNILRGDRAVGLATAVRVRPQLAACNILKASSPVPLRVGDVAIERPLR